MKYIKYKQDNNSELPIGVWTIFDKEYIKTYPNKDVINHLKKQKDILVIDDKIELKWEKICLDFNGVLFIDHLDKFGLKHPCLCVMQYCQDE